MKLKWWRRLRRTIRRFVKKRRLESIIITGSFLFITIATVLTLMQPSTINPAAYQPLMDTIAKGESRGNYNAYFGNSDNNAIKFTDMTLQQVLQWQTDYVAGGSVSSAVGKYQIVRPTLQGLVAQLDLATDQRFDARLQDRLAVALIERRGGQAFVDKKISREQFAANLAKEWAALPKVLGPNPEQSYYAADGINQARLNVAEVFDSLRPLARYRDQS